MDKAKLEKLLAEIAGWDSKVELPAPLSAAEERFCSEARALWFAYDKTNMTALTFIAARRVGLFSSPSFAKDVEYFVQRAIASYLRGHAEEAVDASAREALFWAADHVESGDYMAQEEPPKKEGQ